MGDILNDREYYSTMDECGQFGMEKLSLEKTSIPKIDGDDHHRANSLAVKASQRNPSAYTDLYSLYVTRVYRYLYSRLGDQAEAEEITSQVFLAAWEALPRYKEQGSFTSWLFRIARNKLNDHFRRSRPYLSLDEIGNGLSQSWDPLTSLVQEENLRRLAQIVQKLPRDQFDMLSMRFAGGLTFSEMASILGRSEGAVKMAVSRLVKKLKEEWEQEDE
jgi:RNA polymerase sigma-70 factor, ECF subfamily